MAWNTRRFAGYFSAPFRGPDDPAALRCLQYFLEFVCATRNIKGSDDACTRWAWKILVDKDPRFGTRAGPLELGKALDPDMDVLLEQFAKEYRDFFSDRPDSAAIVETIETHFPFEDFAATPYRLYSDTRRYRLSDLAENMPFHTVRGHYSVAPVRGDEHALYVRKSRSGEYVIGQLTIHHQPHHQPQRSQAGKPQVAAPSAFFTLLTSTSRHPMDGTNVENRRIYVYAGDIAVSSSILICVAAFWTDDLQDGGELGPLMQTGSTDTGPVFKHIDWIRSFNIRRCPDSHILAGIAFIREGDQETAVSPLVGLPMAEDRRVEFDALRRTHDATSIEGMIANLVPEHLQPRARTQFEGFQDRSRYLITL